MVSEIGGRRRKLLCPWSRPEAHTYVRPSANRHLVANACLLVPLRLHSGKHWRAFGDREGDAALWASELVPRLGPPAALLVTGDITDGKVGRKRSHRHRTLRSVVPSRAAARVTMNNLQVYTRCISYCRLPAALASSRRRSGWAMPGC